MEYSRVASNIAWTLAGSQAKFDAKSRQSYMAFIRKCGSSKEYAGVFIGFKDKSYFVDINHLESLPAYSFGEHCPNSVHMTCPLVITPEVLPALRQKGLCSTPVKRPPEPEANASKKKKAKRITPVLIDLSGDDSEGKLPQVKEEEPKKIPLSRQDTLILTDEEFLPFKKRPTVRVAPLLKDDQGNIQDPKPQPQQQLPSVEKHLPAASQAPDIKEGATATEAQSETPADPQQVKRKRGRPRKDFTCC